MSDETAAQFSLNGITEDDFLRWKHHPVSKVLLRYLLDYAERLRQEQLIEIENAEAEMPAKKQGEYKGRIKTVTELATIAFGHLVDFYPDTEEEEDDDA